MSEVEEFLNRWTCGAPAPLRERVLARARSAAGRESLASTLAGAAQELLTEVIRHPGDRSVALDLLASDAMITLALLAQAEAEPEHLGEFAASLLHTAYPTA